MQDRAKTLAYHPYELQSAAPLGALSRAKRRHGALLRVRFEAGDIGYADLHPWTELGDLPLAEQLDRLARGETTGLTRASLAFAALDAEARAAGRSLWDGLTIPESHFLLPSIDRIGREALETALSEGFTRFKIKLGKNLDVERQHLLELLSFLKSVSLSDGGPPRLRLDYNETQTVAQFTRYITELVDLPPFLDFIEDPFPFDHEGWSALSARLQIPLAVDRAAAEDAAAHFNGVIVHKPARSGPFLPQGASAELPRRRLIVTSYLDHPLGQLCAAWVAAQIPSVVRQEKHGLVSHRVYARTRFSDQLGWAGPHLQPPEGHGFGFDDELAGTAWRTL